jgi:hypothetical protein
MANDLRDDPSRNCPRLGQEAPAGTLNPPHGENALCHTLIPLRLPLLKMGNDGSSYFFYYIDGWLTLSSSLAPR